MDKMHCKDCKMDKEYTEFYKIRSVPSGFDYLCILCRRIRNRAYNKVASAKKKKTGVSDENIYN